MIMSAGAFHPSPNIAPNILWELGNAYLQIRGANAELSRGMGFYFLELEIKTRLAEDKRKEPPSS